MSDAFQLLGGLLAGIVGYVIGVRDARAKRRFLKQLEAERRDNEKLFSEHVRALLEEDKRQAAIDPAHYN
jgi:hypothetical protein